MKISLFAIGIVFVVLKLAGVIAWSWWLVTLPFWFILVLILVLIATGVTLVALAS